MTKQSDITNDSKYLPVLDHGLIGLVAHMGRDASIVQAARVSYGAGTKKVNEDRGLIRYLLRQRHTTPFEMCEIQMHVKAPIFVARQLFRHRTGSFNETSFRYSEMSDEFYIPEIEHIKPQALDNKQGRAGEMSQMNATGVQYLMESACSFSHQAYKVLLGDRVGNDPESPGLDVILDPYSKDQPLLDNDFPGTAREIARAVMPVAAYTEFYWKLNLWNLMNFLRLRADSHAQYEIRVYADAIIKLVQPLFPLAFEAFEDYIRGAVSLSRMEAELIGSLMHPDDGLTPSGMLVRNVEVAGSKKEFALTQGMTVRELTEFCAKFGLVLP